MSVQFNGVEYLVGRAVNSSYANNIERYFRDTGERVEWQGQTCPVLGHDSLEGYYVLRYQHLNVQWPTYYPMRTKMQLLEGWS